MKLNRQQRRNMGITEENKRVSISIENGSTVLRMTGMTSLVSTHVVLERDNTLRLAWALARCWWKTRTNWFW